MRKLVFIICNALLLFIFQNTLAAGITQEQQFSTEINFDKSPFSILFPSGNDGLSVISWSFLIIIILAFIYFSAKINIRYRNYKRCVDNIKNNISNDNINLDAIKEYSDFYFAINDFIEQSCEINGRKYAGADIETFINENRLSGGLINSRILKIGAPTLTGIGVLGTFFGLLYGLDGLTLNDNINGILKQIEKLTAGASTAFVTSVWGVFTSILLNFFERIAVSKTDKNLKSLQFEISKIYPTFPASYILLELKDNIRSTSDYLGGLAEQIGSHFQRSLNDFSDKLVLQLSNNANYTATQISSRLSDALTPSIEKISEASRELANRQAETSEKVLESLVNRFTDKLGDAGDIQREAMQQTSANMNKSLSDFASTMKEMIEKIRLQEESFEQKQNEQKEKLSNIFVEICETQEKHSNMLESQVKTMFEQQTTSLTNFENLIKSNVEATQSLLEQGNSLRENITLERDAMVSLVNSLANSSQRMDSTSRNLEEVSKTIENSIEKGSNAAKIITNGFDRISELNKKIVDGYQELLADFKEFHKDLSNISEELNKSTRTASETLGVLTSHYDKLQVKLNQHIDTIDKQILMHSNNFSKLMEDIQSKSADVLDEMSNKLSENMKDLLQGFVSQVNGHLSNQMTAWNEQTRQYTENMQAVIQAMGELIDENQKNARKL